MENAVCYMALCLYLAHHEKHVSDICVLLEALVHDIASRGHSLIKRMVFQDEQVDMLLEGLHKAGLEQELEVS